jgi:NACHT domain- and WD repeat-containing protein
LNFVKKGDNVVECFRNRVQYYYETNTEDPNDPKNGIKLSRNIWKFHRSLDDNLEKISSLTLSDDETYMLATVVWGFKVFFLLTGQSKPLKLPKGVKNIQIGQKKLSFPALFSKENKFVVAGVRDNIYIWETSYGTYIKQLDAHYGRITWCLGSFKDQKNLVLSSSMDKTIKIWNLNNVMEEDFPLDHLEKPIEKIHVSIANSIAMCQSRNQLAVYNLKDGNFIRFYAKKESFRFINMYINF